MGDKAASSERRSARACLLEVSNLAAIKTAVDSVGTRHTGEVIDVEPGEAEWLLDTLEGLFDFYFVQPAILERKRAALNKKLKEADKPPLKSGGGDLPV